MLQQSIVAIHAALPYALMPIGITLAAFAQMFGGAIFISLGQTVFSNVLLPALRRSAPQIEPGVVMAAGATGWRALVPRDVVRGVVLAYNQALTRVFVSAFFPLTYGFVY